MSLNIKRRDFIKTAGITAGGVMLGTNCAISKSSSIEGPLKIGIIGTGDRGTGIINLINKIEEIEVTACCEIIPFRLSAALEMAQISNGTANYQDLLSDPNVDAVVIATPFSMHGQMAIDAIDAGKHIYCEKTMAKGIENIQSVINAAKSSNLVFQTGHQWHSSPLYNRAREIIQSGYLGEITAYECQWNRNGDWRRPVPDPKWERMINWRMYKEYSGGLAAELMSHQIDFINWVTGSHPEKIVGFGGIDYWKDGRETFDNAHVLFEYPSGLDASFTCTTTNGQGDFEIKVLGKEGTMTLDYTYGLIYKEGEVATEKGIVDGVSGATLQSWKKGEGVRIDAPGNDPTIDALLQFRNSIVDGAPIISDIKAGATTAKCVHIILDALHNGDVRKWEDYSKLNFA